MVAAREFLQKRYLGRNFVDNFKTESLFTSAKIALILLTVFLLDSCNFNSIQELAVEKANQVKILGWLDYVDHFNNHGIAIMVESAPLQLRKTR